MLFLRSNKHQNLWNSLKWLWHSYDLSFMKSGKALAAKIIDIVRQHTPIARLCSPRAIRSRKERRLLLWTQTRHKNYFLAFFAYLGFQVANIITFIYWSSELVTKNQYEPSFSELGGFFLKFENKVNSWMLNSLVHSWYKILLGRSLSLVYMVTEVRAHLFHLFCMFKQCVSK